jgi:hypothetical protein
MFEFLAKSFNLDDTPQPPTIHKSAPSVLLQKSSIQDEYVQSVVHSIVATSETGMCATETSSNHRTFYGNNGVEIVDTSPVVDAASLASLDKILANFIDDNSELYGQMEVNIDGKGKLVASDSTRFSFDVNNENSEELKQKYVDKLNSINVGGKSLGEAFLQAYANEFGVDIDEARAEGQDIGGLHFGFEHGLSGKGIITRSGNIIMSIGDTCYWINENKAVHVEDRKLKINISQNADEVKNVLCWLQTDTQNSDANKAGTKSSESISIKFPSLILR